MNEVFKVASFKLILSNRKKRLLRGIMFKFTNALSEVLELVKPFAEEIEFESLIMKSSKRGDKYLIDSKKVERYVKQIVEDSKYKTYRHRERLINDISSNLASYFELRLAGESPSYPIKLKVGDEELRGEYLNGLYQELVNAGITDNGIEKSAHEKETELAGKIAKSVKEKLQPIPFERYRDFRIIEQTEEGKAPKKIALLDIVTNEGGRHHLLKHGIGKSKFTGIDVANGESVEISSITKIPCVLEWSLYHQLNYFNIGTPKSAKLIYMDSEDEFYLYVTFQFLPHVGEDGLVRYIKREFDEEATKLLENEIEEGKKKKAYKCYDALTGETIDIVSVNKTTENKTRITTSYMGVDMGRAVLAAFAIVQKGRVLYKALAETEGLTKKLYSIYEEIAMLQKRGKQERKKARELLKKIEQITKQGIHKTANRIVWARDYYNSQLILENLTGLKKLPQKKVQQYKRLSDTLTYKSQLKGFTLNTFNPPKAYVEVRPSQTSKLCSRCGFTHPFNRQMEISQKDFKCIKCGYETNADLNAAINIARLGEYYFEYKEKYLSFDEYLKEIASCPNANFSEYREQSQAIQKARIILSVANLIKRHLKGQKREIVQETETVL